MAAKAGGSTQQRPRFIMLFHENRGGYSTARGVVRAGYGQ